MTEEPSVTGVEIERSEAMTVTFDDCYLLEKSFDIEVGGHGEAVYSFTATRMHEEMG